MKVGLFNHEDLVINTKSTHLIHKPTGLFTNFEKTENEEETLLNFAKALKELELRIGLHLIDEL